ncbi:hypothetical protein Acr_15g0018340 [Actinidia rufa]|uniref:Uncharacterized protein n=1 Tax=Actinidia rufa TaxID=165716 RepID=A0A7J0FX22_9ERIC|nr:hypothetical protein Acr_15g0018340 [Actinidia rufa]
MVTSSGYQDESEEEWDFQATYAMLEHNEEMDSEEEWDFESPSTVYAVEHNEEMESDKERNFESPSTVYAVTKANTKEEIDFDAQVKEECNPTNNEVATCTVIIEPDESSFAGEAKLGEIGHMIGEEQKIISVIENGQCNQDEMGKKNQVQLQEKLGELRKLKELHPTSKKRMLFAASNEKLDHSLCRKKKKEKIYWYVASGCDEKRAKETHSIRQVLDFYRRF